MFTNKDIQLKCILCFCATTNAFMCPNCQKPVCQSCLYVYKFILCHRNGIFKQEDVRLAK